MKRRRIRLVLKVPALPNDYWRGACTSDLCLPNASSLCWSWFCLFSLKRMTIDLRNRRILTLAMFPRKRLCRGRGARHPRLPRRKLPTTSRWTKLQSRLLSFTEFPATDHVFLKFWSAPTKDVLSNCLFEGAEQSWGQEEKARRWRRGGEERRTASRQKSH